MLRTLRRRGRGNPAAVRRAADRNPNIAFTYAWPFETSLVADFLAAQIARF